MELGSRAVKEPVVDLEFGGGLDDSISNVNDDPFV